MALSEKDRQVLDSIFNPLQVGGGAELDTWMIPVTDETAEPPDCNSATAKAELTESEKKALELEAEAILLAEQKEYNKSIDLFSEAIALYPTRSNTYNNRAQVFRLHGGKDDLAIQDLTKAIALSEGKGNTAMNAFCQRGLLHRTKTDEDAAREDFKRAASLGSAFAKNQLVELNPYAAMCNQMLKEAFLKMS